LAAKSEVQDNAKLEAIDARGEGQEVVEQNRHLDAPIHRRLFSGHSPLRRGAKRLLLALAYALLAQRTTAERPRKARIHWETAIKECSKHRS
jgi:hypothetical protein